MREESFLSYRNYLWLIISLAQITIFSAIYLLVSPIGGHRGGTVYGYTVGIIAALEIVFLMWFAVRKRSYKAHRTSLRAWLSAHIWLGLSLTVIVLLHAGFQLGFNIHSLTFYLMLGVIITGIVGVYFYRTLPEETLSNRGGGSLKNLYIENETLSSQMEQLANKGQEIALLYKMLSNPKQFSAWDLIRGKRIKALQAKEISKLLGDSAENLSEEAVKMLTLVAKQRDVLSQIERERFVLIKLRIWLMLHVPCSLGLVVALAAHIFSVLYYLV